MDKGSPKSPVLYERYKSGCAWSLIRFCDFGQGRSNKKLISNRGLVSHVEKIDITNRLGLLSNSDKRCQCIEDGVKKTMTEDSLKAEATKIREEQMATKQQTKKMTTSTMKNVPDSQPVGHVGKNHRRKASKGFQMHGCKDISTVVYRQLSHGNSVSTSKRFNAAALNEMSRNQVHPRSGRYCGCRIVNCQKNDQLSEINLQVQMNEAAEAFINQKFDNGKYHGRDQLSHQSKHFLDALEILNSNKELFIKLLQDPNSLLVRHIQDLSDSPEKQQETGSLSKTKSLETYCSTRGCEELPCTRKSCDRYPSKGSVDPQPSNKIVVLKSGPKCVQNSAGELSDCSSPQSLHSMRNKAQDDKSAYFSLKRKLRHAIGLSRKEKSLSSTVITLHESSRDILGLGDGGKGNNFKIVKSISPYEIYSDIGRMEKSCLDVKTRVEVGSVKGFEPGTRQQVALNSGSVHDNSKLSIVRHLNLRESDICTDSRKHLSEMLRNENEVFLRKQLPKSLGSIISRPEYDFSFAPSPRRLQEFGFMAGQMRFSPYGNYQMVNEKRQRFQKEKKNSYLGPERQIVEAPASANNKKITNRLQTFDTKPKISEKHFSDIKMHGSVSSPNHSPTGSDEIVEMCNAINMEDINSLGVRLEPNDQHNSDANQSAGMVNAFEENQYLKCLNLDSSVENCTSLSPKNVYSSIPSSVKGLDSVDIKDKAEHPSPVSVLEQFIEDINSPPSTISQPDPLSAEQAVEPKEINYEEPFSATVTMSVDPKINSSNDRNEHKFLYRYIRAVLQASGLNWDELSMKCHSSDQLLKLSLFDKMEALPTQFQGDHRLLFDHINEVLGEVYQSYFSCFPWLSFGKQKIQSFQAGTSMVSEVMKFVDWRLLSQQSHLTLEQHMQKDLAKSITWMDIRTDAGDIVTEMVERLLEELTLETAIDLNIRSHLSETWRKGRAELNAYS